MTAKKYLSTLMLLLLLFIIYHAVVWNIYTKKLFVDGITIGDLGRMSYKINSLDKRIYEQNLPYKHIDFSVSERIDILTIGDSFSNGGPGGVNPFYQDYIASGQHLRVMNIRPFPQGMLETVLILDKIGILNKLQPKAILIESVERSAVDRFSRSVNWNVLVGESLIDSRRAINKRTDKKPKPSWITHLNYNALLYHFLYRFDDNAFFSKVFMAELTKDFFSCKNSNQLLFYYEDLKGIEKVNKRSIVMINDNFNKLQKKLSSKNIKLYFMPAVDKYNLYSKYIVNNKHQKSSFFELMRELPKDYSFIDTKDILQNLLEKQELDVYYSDDTHWSYKASKAIFSVIKF